MAQTPAKDSLPLGKFSGIPLINNLSAKKLMLSCFSGNRRNSTTNPTHVLTKASTPRESVPPSPPLFVADHTILHEEGPDDPFSLSYDKNLVNFALRVFRRDETPRGKESRSLGHSVLAEHDRGVIVVGWNDRLKERTVVRVTACHSGTKRLAKQRNVTAADISEVNQSADRLLLFGQFLDRQKRKHIILPGIIPHVSRPTCVQNQFVLEQYQEILYENNGLTPPRRLDLHAWVLEQAQTIVSPRRETHNRLAGFSYLYDALEGIAALHSRGWVHLDVSLENVVLSDERAFLIDFESALPYATTKFGCLRRNQLGVPMKVPFLPPEHSVALSNDLMSLRSYDIWAFGVMLFVLLFGEYPFGFQPDPRCKTDDGIRYILDQEEVEYFLAYGFAKFMKRFHPEKYTTLSRARARHRQHSGKYSGKSSSSSSAPIDLKLAGDLLTGIFRRTCSIILRDSTEVESHFGMKTSHSSSSGSSHETSGCFTTTEAYHESQVNDREQYIFPVYHCDCRRFTAEDILSHPFWRCVNN